MWVVREGNISKTTKLSQRLVLFSRLDEDGQVGIGVFPKGKEILVRLARGCRDACQSGGAADAEVGHCMNPRERIGVRLVNDLLELRRRLSTHVLLQVENPAQVGAAEADDDTRSEEHTSELQSHSL